MMHRVAAQTPHTDTQVQSARETDTEPKILVCRELSGTTYRQIQVNDEHRRFCERHAVGCSLRSSSKRPTQDLRLLPRLVPPGQYGATSNLLDSIHALETCAHVRCGYCWARSIAISSCAAEAKISRESFSSFTARAIETAPTNAASVVIALARFIFLFDPLTRSVSSPK